MCNKIKEISGMAKGLLGIKELAKYLGITEGTLYSWVCQRKIPYLKVGRLVKFDMRKIEKWLEERSIEVYN